MVPSWLLHTVEISGKKPFSTCHHHQGTELAKHRLRDSQRAARYVPTICKACVLSNLMPSRIIINESFFAFSLHVFI